MAVTFTVTPSTQYLEDNITVKITNGTLPSGARIVVLAQTPQGYNLDVDDIAISGTTKTFKLLQQWGDTNYFYEEWPTQSSIKFIFDIHDRNDNSISTAQVTKTLKIKPDPPKFVGTPTYEVLDAPSLTLTNNNQKIINGLSAVKISGFTGQAKKAGTIKYISVSGTLYSYEQYINNNQRLNIPNFSLPENVYFNIDLIDSRGWSTTLEGDTFSFNQTGKDLLKYHAPIINEMTVERNGISELTKLYIKGVYTEGYQSGINPLNFSYKYQEITDSGGTPIIDGETTQFTITRTATSEWEEKINLENELANPHYIDEWEGGTGDKLVQYYEKQTWENLHIDELFEQAILYNDKYTEEYLEHDYDSVNQRYYLKSGGYDTYGWEHFWEDTIDAINTKLYGTYIYGKQNKDYGIGGNYEFEIQATPIEGDIPDGGFSMEKTFNIWGKITDILWPTEQQKTLPTAIPAIDVYKDNIAIHGLYDEQVGGTQINGNLYLNGEELKSNVLNSIVVNLSANESVSISNAWTYYYMQLNNVFSQFGNKLTFEDNNFCVRIGAGVHHVRVSANIMLNGINGYCIAGIRNGTTWVSQGYYRPTNTSYYGIVSLSPQIIEVQQGDNINIGFGAGATGTLVIAGGNYTYLNVEVID